MVSIKMGKFVRYASLGTILLTIAAIGVSCSSSKSGEVGTNTDTVYTGTVPMFSGQITTFSGDGTQGFNGDGLDRTKSWHNLPMEMSFAPDGQLYLIDWNNFRIRRLKSDETWETLIGTDTPGDWPCEGPTDPDCQVPLDGTIPGTELNINHWIDLVFEPDDTGPTMYTLTFAAWHNHKVTHYDPDTGLVTVISGNGKRGFDYYDSNLMVTVDGDSPHPARDAYMDFPSGAVVDKAGNLFITAQRSNRVRRIAPDAARTVTTVVGSSDPPTTPGYAGDGNPATQAILGFSPATEDAGSDNPEPGGSTIMAADGSLYIADTYNNCIRKVAPGNDASGPDGISIIGNGDPAEEIITRVAGICGEAEYGYLDGPALDARFHHPRDLDFGPDGLLYVADTDNSRIRTINLTTGAVGTVAGNGTVGFSGDGGPATEAALRNPYGMAVDTEGNLYIVDTKNNRIRFVAK